VRHLRAYVDTQYHKEDSMKSIMLSFLAAGLFCFGISVAHAQRAHYQGYGEGYLDEDGRRVLLD
jgi:hypothetical protein